jgi:3-deoxy-D-manno-octulosonic-acid transferase
MAQRTFNKQAEIVYLPMDFSIIILKWLKKYPPMGFLVIENGIWPNLIYWIKKKNIKLAMLNGRVNDRTYHRYKNISFFLRAALNEIDLYCVQTKVDARRLIELGAIPERVLVIGNAKYDRDFPDITAEEKDGFLNKLGISPKAKIIVAGSTHPGEEEFVLDAYDIIYKSYPDTILVIAPRHIETVEELEKLLNCRKITYQLRSSINKQQAGQVLLLDTFGELSKFYNMAYLAFVGGSFVPIGGHNLLEPAAQGCPVFFGPYIKNFQEIAELLYVNGVGFKVHTSNELAAGCLSLLGNQEYRRALGVKSRELVYANQGATKKMAKLYTAILK